LAMYITNFGFMGLCGPSKMHKGKVRWKSHFTKLLSSIKWATMPTILQIFLCKQYQKNVVISKNQHRARIGEQTLHRLKVSRSDILTKPKTSGLF
jgi:hypothetical protein